MSGITSSVGIFSGINSGQLIEQLLAVEARPKQLAQQRITALQGQRAAFLDINSSLLALKSAAGAFRVNKTFDAAKAASSDTTVFNATAGVGAQPGTYSLSVARLVSTQQQISRGFADRNSTGVGSTGVSISVGGGRLDSDTTLANLNGGAGVQRGKIRITDASGGSAVIDLSTAVTVRDVLDAINANGAANVTATVSGDGFRLVDNSVGSGTFRVENLAGSTTATSLGIAATGVAGVIAGSRVNVISGATALASLNDGTGVSFRSNTAPGQADLEIVSRDGTLLKVELGRRETTTPPPSGGGSATVTVIQTAASTLQEVVDRINNTAGNGGKVVASIDASTNRLVLTDNTGGSSNLIVREPVSGDPTRTTARDLGLLTAVGGVASSTLSGRRLIAGLNSIQTASLNGGRGVGAGTFQVTRRDGTNFSVSLTANASVNDVIASINAAGAGTVTARLNSAGNGLTIADATTGGNLIISDTSGTAAADLKIATAAGGTASGVVNSGNLSARYLSGATLLTSLNARSGVGTGSFTVADSTGVSSTITIDAADRTLDDVIRKINQGASSVRARINDTGDGLVLYESNAVNPGAIKIKVADTTGSVASKLNIAGESASGVQANNKIDGRFSKTVALAATDTLDQIVSKINASGFGVSAAIIGDGSGSSPFRLTLTSRNSGAVGEAVVDFAGADLGLNTLTRGRDAVVFFGAADPANAVLLTSATNSITSAVQGVTIDLARASTTPVTLTVTRDNSAIETAIGAFVDTFNKAIDKFQKYDSYDDDTKKKGVLLGDSTVAQLRSSLYNAVQGRAQGVNGPFQRLLDIGVTIGSGGKLAFDADKFRNAYAANPQAVKDLVSAFDQAPTSGAIRDPNGNPIPGSSGVPVLDPNGNPIPGAFTSGGTATYRALGVGEQIRVLVERLTDTVSGSLTRRDQDLNSQITLQNERITQFDIKLDAKRERLQRQFQAMEQAIASLRTQQNSLGSIQAVSAR